MLNYEEFTKRKPVTKGIKFELIPYGRTAQTILEKGDRKYDEALYSALERLKPVIDSFIRDIASKALTGLEFDFEPMYEAILDKNKKAFSKEEKALKKALDASFKKSFPKEISNASKINSAKFLQKSLRDYITQTTDKNINKDEALKDIDETKGCLSLFNKFLVSRETAITTWIPERVIENLRIFAGNIPKIESLLEEGGQLTEGIEDELILMKTPSYYGQLLSQKDIDGYNTFIGGSANEKGIMAKGLNSLINEHNIEIRSQKIDKKYLKTIQTLHKQVLFPSEKKFVVTSISTDDEVREVTKNVWQLFNDNAKKMETLLKEKAASTDGDGIIIKGRSIHTLSHLLTGEHNTITDRLANAALAEINDMLSDQTLKPSMRRELEKRTEIIHNHISKKDYEMSELNEAFNEDKSILAPSKTVFARYVDVFTKQYATAKMYYKVLEGGDIFEKRRIKGSRHVQEMLVDFYSSLTDIRETLNLIKAPEDDNRADISFYNFFEEIYEEIRLSYKAENLVRNYITKSEKDLSQEKQTCLGTPARFRTQWWNGEDNFAKDKATIIRHDGRYYYFILAGDSKPVDIKESKESDADLLQLKKGAPSYLTLPRAMFSKEVVNYFKNSKDNNEYTADDEYIIDNASVIRPVKITKEIFDIYNKGFFRKEAVANEDITEEQYRQNLIKLIDKYKEFTDAYIQYQKFNLEDLGDSDSYADIGEYFSDVDTHTSKFSWLKVEYKQIESLVEQGVAYLFLISNKFLYTDKEQNNPYTKTFLSILSDNNIDKTTTLLCSNPAIYFRPALLERKPVHKKGSFLVNHRTEDGEPIPKSIYEAIYKVKNEFSNVTEAEIKKADEYLKAHKVRIFKAPIDRYYKQWYMTDKYFLQLTYNKNNEISDRYNDMLNDRVREAMEDGYNVISVARSTGDMVYVMVLDSEMNIIEEKSLNVIGGIDYYAMLHDASKEKLENKKAWIYDTESADLKAAYIDLAITEIINLARKYNAVIAVEGISDAVKDKYSFIDNQVFRAFEDRISQRLSDLAIKTIMDGRAGSMSNPLQLANHDGNTYQDGILFYVNAAYTRGVDINSGFANIFDLLKINSIASKRQFFSSMDNIIYTGSAITFSFDYNNFAVKYNTNKTKWQITIEGDAVIYDKEKKKNILISDIVNELIIPKAGKTDLNKDLAPQMLSKDVPGVFVEELFRWFRYTLSGMHKKTNVNEEFYRSPIDGSKSNISHAAAFNLARKLSFTLEYAGEGKNYTSEWLNYIQG